MRNFEKTKKIATNTGLLIFAFLCLTKPASLEAELFGSSGYEKCRNDKLACELQIKYCRKKSKELKNKVQALDECRNEKSALEETVGRREGKIKTLEAARKRGNSDCEKDKAVAANNIRELEQAINILRQESAVQEKDLAEERKRMNEKHKAALNKMAKKLEESRNSHILETGAMRKDCEARIVRMNEKIAKTRQTINKKNKKISSLKDETEKAKNKACPPPKSPSPPPGLKLLNVQEGKFQKALKKEIGSGGIGIIRFGDRLVISIGNGFLFVRGSTKVKKKIFPVLKKISRVLAAYPKTSVVIEGHSDSDKLISSIYKDNWELSAQRALSALRAILQSSTLDKSRFSAAGRGEHNPLAPNTSPKNKALNRRVEIVIKPL